MKSRFMGGTLVVCALSLVGQWQEEAKKFCSDKIKICAYHGGNRIRDPKRLSEYDIVVTTYQTLGADIFAKARRNKKKIKAGLFDEYVNPNDLIELARKGKLSTSPCHSVAWYRVIVDESHLIKNPTARMSLATTSLYSKHSLLVTGTPINSSVQDLAGQMKVFQIHDTVALKGLVDTEMCSKFFQRKSSRYVK
jgi:SWI/SNF-related matrix-associated actin-dependent regulator of chromatin subfamily A3